MARPTLLFARPIEISPNPASFVPFALRLSKGLDKLSPNGVGYFLKHNRRQT